MSDRKTIGVVLDWPDATSNYQKLLLSGIRGFAAEHDVNLIAFAVGRLQTPFLWERGREFLYDYIGLETVDGVLVYSAALSNFSGIEALEERLRPFSSLPRVSIGLELNDTPSVLVDNRVGFRELVAHLIQDHGYRRLGYIGGPNHNEEAALRRDTFLRTAAELGIEVPESHLYEGTFLIASGNEAVQELLYERGLALDALVCANDNMAIGAWQELWSRRHVIPVDIAVTGFDDLEVSTLLELPFTTVRQPLFDQGYTAAEMLFDVMQGKARSGRSETRELPTEVVYRGSCGCATRHRVPPQSLSGEDDTSHGDRSRFFEREIGAMRRAAEHFRNRRSGDPLIRAWNAVLLHAIEGDVKQREVTSLFWTTHDELVALPLPDDLQAELQRKLEKMGSMIVDFYIQADLLNRLTDQGTLQDTL